MNSQTITVLIAATPAKVHAFASNPVNLPKWVPSFCKSIELVNGAWVVHTSGGPVGFAFDPSNEPGMLDHTVTLPSGLKLTNPMRVVPKGTGSEVQFTLTQNESMSDQQFKEDAAMVRSDLNHLKRIVESEGT